MSDPRIERVAALAAELGELRREVRTGFSQVHTELAAVRSDSAAEQERTRGGFAELRAEFAAGHERSRAESAAVREEMQAGFAAERERAQAESAALRAEIRADVRDGFAEMRRHFDVVVEGFRATNQLLAEGLITLNERIDRLETRFETRMAEGFAELRDLIRLAYTDLDRRVRVLEGRAGV
jgi:hypothetical protein